MTQDGLNFGTLDIFGAPVITIKVKNANNLLTVGDVTITYKYSTMMLLMKPLYLSSIILALLLLIIFSFRVNMSLDTDKKKKD